MKKCLILVLLILLALSSVCYAGSFDIGMTGSIDFLNSYEYYGGGLHLGWTNYFGQEMVGIGVFGNIGYQTLRISKDKEIVETLRATAMIGPVFNFIRIGIFSLPISAGLVTGIHAPTNFSTYNDFSMILGIGLNITPQIDIEKNMRGFFRPQVALNFFDIEAPHVVTTFSLGVSFSLSSNAVPRASNETAAPPAAVPAPVIYSPPPPVQPASPWYNTVEYFISFNKDRLGPFNLERLKLIEEMGIFTKETLVWKDGMDDWVPAGNQEDLSPLFKPAPPPLP